MEFKVGLPDLASPTPCASPDSPDKSCGIIVCVTGQLSVPAVASVPRRS
jgi:hypothetical protein